MFGYVWIVCPNQQSNTWIMFDFWWSFEQCSRPLLITCELRIPFLDILSTLYWIARVGPLHGICVQEFFRTFPGTSAQSNSYIDMGSLQRCTFSLTTWKLDNGQGWSCEDSPNSTLNIWNFQFTIIDFENEKLSHKFARFFFFQGSSYVYSTVKIWTLMNCFSCFFQIQDWVWRAHHTECSNCENSTLTSWFLRFPNGTERKNLGVHQAWFLRCTEKFPTLKSSSANLLNSSVQ